MMLIVFSVLGAATLLASLFYAAMRIGRWRQRAQQAEAQNKIDRKAHEIQNRIIFDPAERERVRRKYDTP